MLGLGILHNGKRLTFGQYFSRNFALWVSAFACGIPILHLYTMISQYERLKAGQPASYDEKNSFNVCAKPTGWLRKITFGSVFFSIIVFVFVISHSVDYGLARKEPANVAENKLQVSFPLRATPTISAVAASDSLPIILSVDVATSEAIEVVSDIASAPEPPKLGRFNLGEFIATSRDEDLHYIKIVVEVGYIGDLEKELEAHKEALRDCITNILMKLTIQRAKEDYIDRFLHKDIERELNRILNRSKSESRIISVFIPTFLIN